jgi:hypothetical protein
MLIKQSYCPFSGAGFKHVPACTSKLAGDLRAHQRFVFDDEHDQAAVHEEASIDLA